MTRDRGYTGMGFHSYRPLGHHQRRERFYYDAPVYAPAYSVQDVGEIRTGIKYPRDCDPTTIVDANGVTRYVHDQTNCNR